MTGLRTRRIASVSPPKRSPPKTSTKDFSAISRTSAPAAKALSEPVRTMQRTLSFSSAAVMGRGEFGHQLGVQRVHRVGPVQADQGNVVLDLDDDGLVGHGFPLFGWRTSSTAGRDQVIAGSGGRRRTTGRTGQCARRGWRRWGRARLRGRRRGRNAGNSRVPRWSGGGRASWRPPAAMASVSVSRIAGTRRAMRRGPRFPARRRGEMPARKRASET